MPILPWARRIDKGLQELGEIPLFGQSEPFDFEEASKLLSKEFKDLPISINMQEAVWKEKEHLLDSLGKGSFIFGSNLLPIEEKVLWLMSKKDVAYLTSWLLYGNTGSGLLESELLQDGFYRFILVNSLYALQNLLPLQSLTLSLNEETLPIDKKYYCIRISISFKERSCSGILALSCEFLQSWRRHFSSAKRVFALSSLAKHVEIPVSLVVGHVEISQKEFNKLKKGDALFFEKGNLATILVGKTPLFFARIEENKITLVNSAPIYEESMESSKEETARAVSDISLSITIELARLNITVESLLHLSSGDILELPIHPEQGVMLTVNGKIVGRGEILMVGENSSVRILELV